MGDDKCAEISRNELASYFQCAPSQINYVLKTRFTTERGFNVVGQRGGGGFIRIEKFDAKADGYLESILPSLENPTSYTRSKQIICHLVDDGVISRTRAIYFRRQPATKRSPHRSTSPTS
ncbi:MAG: CtsR family transcriptional regulator [Clostridiales bacterium]|nr:MAG: CtsR family transcriptional regulator [Clostridiales bacterium]